MTIAGFYLTPEGVVLGADSTTSAPTDTGMHYLDFNQKIFQIGEDSTLGMLTWGLGGLAPESHRTLVARLADSLAAQRAATIEEVADRWIALVWPHYQAFPLLGRYHQLDAKIAHDPAVAASRTKDEEQEYLTLKTGLVLGFCIAGHVLPDRAPRACSMVFDPTVPNPPVPQVHAPESFSWWGVPNIVSRLVFGADDNFLGAILATGQWKGSPADLVAVRDTQRLVHASLPIRDAVDYVYSCIYSTIKAMKFSTMAQVCGGPIEIAVITTDRKFRWVRHKPWDAAIIDGESDVRPTHHHHRAS